MSDPKYYHSALRDKRESGRARLRASSSLTDKGENGSKDAGIRASTSGGSRVDEGMRSLFSFFPFFFLAPDTGQSLTLNRGRLSFKVSNND